VGDVFETRCRRAHRRLRRPDAGFSLLDLMLAVGIVGILLAVAIPSYARYMLRANTSAAVADVGSIHLAIETYIMNDGQPPPTLAAIGKGGMLDPWGRPYVYLSFSGMADKGRMRKDKNLVPINSEYDLYSVGPDGDSVPPLTAKPSLDDIVMANNGKFVGLASDY
jgi:general secretion pathway protein G